MCVVPVAVATKLTSERRTTTIAQLKRDSASAGVQAYRTQIDRVRREYLVGWIELYKLEAGV